MRLAVAAVWLLASQADADNFTNTWDISGSSFASPVDGSGEWSTSVADWSTGSADVAWPTPAPTAYTAVFGNGGAAGTVTITSPVVVAGLTFDSVASSNYTIVSSGPSDTLTLSLPTTITVGSGLSPTINATIAGTSGLVVAGADTSATLTLGGSNTYTGGTNIQSGNLAITSDAAINNGVGGIAFNGGNLQFNNYTSNLSFSNDESLNLGAAAGAASTLSGNITGLTYLTYFGPGTLILNGTNTYSGNTYVANGTLVAGNVGALPSGRPIYFYVGATLAIDSDADIGNSTSGLNFVSGGTLQFNNYASNLSFDNIANLGLGAAAGTASTLQGTITGSSGLTYVGPGTLVLAGSNSYTGGTTVSRGTLNLNAAPGTGPLAINGDSSIINVNSTFANAIGSLSGTGTAAQLNVAPFQTLSVNQTASGPSGTFAGTLSLGASSGLATASPGTGTLTLTGAPTLGPSSSLTVNSGTLAFNVNGSTPATVGTGVTATVASGSTLQLAGMVSALSDPVSGNAANITTHGTGSANDGALTVVGTTNQTVGVVSGDTMSPDLVTTTYSGNTTVGDGTNVANLTATQILQNTLTINAGSTVTIAPSGSGIPTGDVAATAAIATGDVEAGAASTNGDSTSDPFTAIEAAIDSGAISSAKGQQLENRIAAIERLAATDPGLDVSPLEDRVLAVIPSPPVWSSSGTSPLVDSGTSLLAVDSSTIGSSSDSALGSASAAFAPSAAFGGIPAAVPEPSTLLLTAMGALGLAFAGRRRAIRCRR